MGDASTQKIGHPGISFLLLFFDPGTLPSKPKKAGTTGAI
jgi:hypothetical protein